MALSLEDRLIQATCKAILKQKKYSFVSVPVRQVPVTVVAGIERLVWVWPKKGVTYRKPADVVADVPSHYRHARIAGVVADVDQAL